MPVTIGGGCRAHDQDNAVFCGEAVEMMIAAREGAALTALSPQSALAALRRQSPPPAFTAAADVRDVLGHFLPGSHFSVQQRAAQDEAMADIIFALKANGVPVAVLLGEGVHWAVVAAVQTDVDPVPGRAYSVQHVYANSPKVLRPPAPNPHAVADVCFNAVQAGILVADVITYDRWCSDLFVGMPIGAERQFTAVCKLQGLANNPAPGLVPPGLPPAQAAESSPQALGAAPLGALPGGGGVDNLLQPTILRPNAPTVPAPRPLSQKDMVAESKAVLAAMLMPGDPPRTAWQLMKGAKPSRAVRVQRLDDSSRCYFLVPWSRDGRVIVTTEIDGATGRFASAHFHSAAWYADLSGANPKTRLRLSELRIDVAGGALAQLKLGWRPCCESSSPHFPFLQVTGRVGIGEQGLAAAESGAAGAGSDEELFVRLDGNVFPGLTARIGVGSAAATVDLRPS